MIKPVPFVVDRAIVMRRGRDGVFRQAARPREPSGIRGVEYSYTVVDELVADAERILEILDASARPLELRLVAGVWQLAPARQLVARHS